MKAIGRVLRDALALRDGRLSALEAQNVEQGRQIAALTRRVIDLEARQPRKDRAAA